MEGLEADNELAEASRRLHDYREAERLRLARDLHDGAVQDLINMGFALAQIQRQMEQWRPQVDVEPVLALKADVVRVVRALRGLVAELRPAGLKSLAFASTRKG